VTSAAIGGLLVALGGCSPQVSLGGEEQTIGGRLRGLTPGETITLQDSLGETLTLSSNGAFAFPKPVGSGATYSVASVTNPSSPVAQTCSVSNGSGTAGGSPIANITVDCDLLAYFPFQGNADDASGYGHDAVVVGATLASDRHGNANSAYSFAGVGSIQAAMPTGFLPNGSSPRTLVAWLEPAQSTKILGLVYWGAENCNGKVFGMGDLGDKATFWGGCNDYTSALALPIGSWSFLAVVYTPAVPTQITLYVGSDVETGPIVAPATPDVGSLVIGADLVNGGPAFTGKIGSVRVYGRALNAAEVQAVFISPAP
jgi:Concanavalin A-like lectin/glucanases superfamily